MSIVKRLSAEHFLRSGQTTGGTCARCLESSLEMPRRSQRRVLATRQRQTKVWTTEEDMPDPVQPESSQEEQVPARVVGKSSGNLGRGNYDTASSSQLLE